MKDVLRRHPKATVIWAHTGLGRVVHPVQDQATTGAAERSPRHVEILEGILEDPGLAHVHFDISWDEVAKYVVATPASLESTAALLNRFSDRFLFGTDEVAPADQTAYLKVYRMYDPLWKKLTPEASERVRTGNYERLFDEARHRVRAWEKANLK
jgi:predicted TIM-barrel fold metal-dependent hydrolase